MIEDGAGWRYTAVAFAGASASYVGYHTEQAIAKGDLKIDITPPPPYWQGPWNK